MVQEVRSVWMTLSFSLRRMIVGGAIRDQNGTVHTFDYDGLGRPIQDRITTLGAGVDGTVRRISTSFEVRGMREKITSWNAATVGSGSVVNEVQFAYNDFGQVIHGMGSDAFCKRHMCIHKFKVMKKASVTLLGCF